MKRPTNPNEASERNEELMVRLRNVALAMRGDPKFDAFIALLRERREHWVQDLANPAVLHNHSELAATAATITELDIIIDLATADAGQA